MDHKHIFVPSEIHKDYECCVVCDSYHSTSLMDQVQLYENEYWDEKNGHSYWGDQINNLSIDYVNGYTKVGKIFSYLNKPGRLLEIGCAPGVVLNRARRRKYDAYGIEPDATLIPEIIKVAQCDPDRIIHGYFPCVRLPIKFDYVIAMDVVEHIEDYRSFIQAIYDALDDGGKFVMMSPMIVDGRYRERDFCAHEHAWIFQFKYLSEYLCGLFPTVMSDAWQEGHEMLIAIK